MNTYPNFRNQKFLIRHIQTILDFYQPGILDSSGGFNQNFLDNGSVFDCDKKHLVSSCRMIFNYCLAEKLFGSGNYNLLWQHGLRYLRNSHWDDDRQGYVWMLENQQVTNDTNYSYGLAFVILAFAAALKMGEETARLDIYRTWDLLNKHFWQPDTGLYADEVSADWNRVADYRGQNANMHVCEALLLAYEVTDDLQFLDRAESIAKKIVIDQADKSEGLIWEHFKKDLSIDWEFNKEDPKNLYRPWGFQPGHQTEWAKLLIILSKHKNEGWMIERARLLFDRALETAWDNENGGIFYGFAPDGGICDTDKYFWVQAESFAAACLLAKATGDELYWQWYDRIWQFCWNHFIDHEHGAWFRLLTASNQKTSNIKSEAGAKCDYHTLGACMLVLEILK